MGGRVRPREEARPELPLRVGSRGFTRIHNRTADGDDAAPAAPGLTSPAGATGGAPAREDTIETLTSRQRAHLRSLAHHLKPILQVGNDGITDAVIDAIDEAFNTRELFKVKVLEGAPVDAREAADAIRQRVDGAFIPQVIGRTIVLYRPFPEDPEIRLP